MAQKGKTQSSGQLPLQGEASIPALRNSQPKPANFLTKGERQEFFIPVSGFIWLYPEEVRVVDHPAFQRLGKIYQLGQTYLVYRGATHKRFEHALGSVHIVQRMIDALRHTHEKANLRRAAKGLMLNEHEERFIRLGALLHDVGHIAAGHTVEDELGLIGKHDHDDRLDMLLVDRDRYWVDSSDKTLGELIDSEFTTFVPPELAKEEITASHIVRLLVRKPPKKNDNYSDQQSCLERSSALRLNICRDMIGNTICADILDYIHRDWYHIGKSRPFDERILQYMEIRSRTRQPILQGNLPASASDDEFVISLGKRPKIRTDAISSILELLEWRYQLAETVLFHRTKLAGAAMLDRALFELWADGDKGKIEKFLLPLSDEQMVAECRKEAEELARSTKSETDLQRGTVASKLLSCLEKRQLFTGLCTFTFADLPGDVHARIQSTYGRSEGENNSAPANRARALRILEDDFKLPPGSLAIYCPTAAMNAKIAEVKIAVGEETEKFCVYEENHSRELSGGHLDAQLHRFKRLWRVHFFIDRAVKQKLKTGNELVLKLLRDAVEKLVLGNLRPDEDPEQVAESFAISLTATNDSPWLGHKMRNESARAAYRDASAASAVYPTGTTSIRSYIDS